MNLRQQILTRNDCYTTGVTIRPRGVMVHSTGTNNPNVSRYVPGDSIIGYNPYNNHWNKPGIDKCVHAFIGKFADGSIGTVQTLPWDWRGWHCGTGTSGRSANDTHISFEICEDALSDKNYFNRVYLEAVQLTAYLCKRYRFDPLEDGVVICHKEGYNRGIASNHADVLHWFTKFGKGMGDFRNDVALLLEDNMTQEQFNVMMDNWLAQRAQLPASDWAKPYIQEAIDAGLMANVDGSIERPQSFVTRQELATVAAAIKK